MFDLKHSSLASKIKKQLVWIIFYGKNLHSAGFANLGFTNVVILIKKKDNKRIQYCTSLQRHTDIKCVMI